MTNLARSWCGEKLGSINCRLIDHSLSKCINFSFTLCWQAEQFESVECWRSIENAEGLLESFESKPI